MSRRLLVDVVIAVFLVSMVGGLAYWFLRILDDTLAARGF